VIFTQFGNAVTIASKPDDGNILVKRLADGELRIHTIASLKADGGFEEILDAIDAFREVVA
jgi:hypothetical protein